LVIVSQIYSLFDGSSINAVRADGRAARERHASGGVSAFACEDCGAGPVTWEIDIDSGFPERFDVVVVPADAATPPR
jgi:hypothetical protein